MDTNNLVNSGHSLLRALDDDAVSPRAALWVRDDDADTWRLWIVPDPSITDKREFYRRVAEAITKNGQLLQGIDVSDTEFTSASHPAVKALAQIFRLEDQSSVSISSSMFDGFYLPDAVLLRMDLARTQRVNAS